MRTLLIVFAFLLLFDSCKEKRNVKKTYYKSGSIASEVTFKDSDTLIKNGEAKFYYQNGKLKKRLLRTILWIRTGSKLNSVFLFKKLRLH